MNDGLYRLFYLANCGVLADLGGVRVLVDGLQAAEGVFDQTPRELEEQIIEGAGPFQRIDLLIFTHLHFDHFDLEKTMRFLRSHPQTKLVAPIALCQAIRDPLSRPALFGADVPCDFDVQTMEALLGNRAWFMDPDAAAPFSLAVSDLTVTAVNVPHISFDYRQHFCLMLSCAEGDFLFTGDLDLDKLSAAADSLELRSRLHLAAFFNPLLLGKPKWPQEVASWNAEKIFLYHIPCEALDHNGYRKLALRRAPRYAQLLPQMELLLSPMKELSLSIPRR